MSNRSTPRRIDAHCHVWPPGGAALAAGVMPQDRRPPDYPIETHLRRVAPLGIGAAVLVPHIAYYGRDLSYAFECAGRWPGRCAVMGAVTRAETENPQRLSDDLDLGVRSFRIRAVDLARPLDDLCGLLKSVRAVLCPLITRVQAEAGALQHVAALAARHPQLQFVLDHFGGWPDSPAFEALAGCPNVLVKISDFAAFDAPPYARALDATLALCGLFGAQRLMWGSNMPVVELDAWQRLEDAFTVIETAVGLNPIDKAAILGGTAERIFFTP